MIVEQLREIQESVAKLSFAFAFQSDAKLYVPRVHVAFSCMRDDASE